MMRVSEALIFMAEMLEHKGKVRKGNGAPYSCHLGSVVATVASYGGGENTQLAAAFHDAVEDCAVTLDQIEKFTNPQVTNIVRKLSEDKSLPWKQRKQSVVDLAGKCCQGVGIVLVSDKIDNITCMIREMPFVGTDAWDVYWKQFNAGYKDQAWFFSALCDALWNNDRLMSKPEYPELATGLAVTEFEGLVAHFLALGADPGGYRMRKVRSVVGDN
jgi:hypothetical protein